MASVSGALIATAAIGLFLWSVGVLMTRVPLVLKAIQFPGVVIVAVLLTSVTFTITQLTTAAMAIGGCALIAGLTPKHERTLPPSDLGPLFSLVTRCLALLFMASLSAYFISRSTPAHEVLDSMTPINEWWPSQSSLLGADVGFRSAHSDSLSPYNRAQVFWSDGGCLRAANGCARLSHLHLRRPCPKR